MKKNKIEFEGNLMYLYPTNNLNIKVILDKDEYDKINEYCWACEKDKFIINFKKGLYLHRYIMNIHNNKDKRIKYKDGNIYNLQKDNLLLTDKYQKGNTFLFDDNDDTIVYLILNNDKYILDIEDYNKLSKYTWNIKYKSYLLESSTNDIILFNLLLNNKSKHNKYRFIFKNNNSFDYRKNNLHIEYFKNSIVLEKDDYIIVIPTNSNNEYIFDKEYKEILSKYIWHEYKKENNNTGYLRTIDKIISHWFIIGQPLNGLVVDHIDRNTLNNRKSNLRVVTIGINNQNRKFQSNNKSGFMGVVLRNNIKSIKYESYIRYNKINYYLGTFINIIDAAKTYDKKAIEFYGNNASTNEKLGRYEIYYNNLNNSNQNISTNC